MSYDLGLKDPVSGDWCYLNTPHFMQGGTFCRSGEHTATINITYNYCHHFRVAMENKNGIRALYGMTGAKSISILKDAISKLKNDVSDDYWEATEGNAKRALLQCLALAEMRPDGIWDGD